LDLGINASILSSSLSMIVAQRLIRLLCPQCATLHPPEPHEIQIFTQNNMEPPDEIARSVGCESCLQSGYRGRVGVYEVILVDRTIEKLIFAGALHREIEDAAKATGTTLMFKQALKKVAKRLTSIEEVVRVIVDYA
jgi:type II secretory ATPase GspE/PulE/Tfp pilus assembly ATPase PilB-like protein